METPKAKTVWIIWAVVMALYSAMNYFMIRPGYVLVPPPDQLTILGWAIVMPILTNLVWWIIAFRLRFYFPKNWWAFGIVTTFFVGIAGLLTMIYTSST